MDGLRLEQALVLVAALLLLASAFTDAWPVLFVLALAILVFVVVRVRRVRRGNAQNAS